MSDLMGASHSELDRAIAWKITGVLLAGLVVYTLVPVTRIAVAVGTTTPIAAAVRALIDTVIVGGTVAGVFAVAGNSDRPGILRSVLRVLAIYAAADLVCGLLLLGGFPPEPVIVFLPLLIVGAVVVGVRAITGSVRWPHGPFVAVVVGSLVVREAAATVSDLALGYYVYPWDNFATGLEFVVLSIAMIVALIVHFASAGGTSRHVVPAHVGFTTDGQPIFPVVGYTSDGSPVTADRAQDVRVQSAQTNSLAIAALVTSLAFWPAGIILGHVSRGQIRRTGEGGGGMALAALIIGYLSLAVTVAAVIAVVAAANSAGAF